MNRTIRLEISVWYDAKSRHIKLAGDGLTASTVSNDPTSKRYHPNLYRKLARCLHEAGVPAPAPNDADAAASAADHAARPGNS